MEDFSTLLLGETGTGKGQAAAAIGRSEFIPYLPAERRFAANFTETFIAINLSQFPETLIESELFGHRKGAFTGAIDHHQGVFERCSAHGALFLDEIGEVAIPVQIKLLQVLQERTFTPIGGREKKRFSGRVIAATNQPLDRLRRERRFRDDFFYRLCSDVIEVPTLRQRLAESSAEIVAAGAPAGGAHHRRWTGPTLVADRVLEQLEASVPRGYLWPGNVRELEQAVRRILLTGRYVPETSRAGKDEDELLLEKLRAGELTAGRAPRPLQRHAAPAAGHLCRGGQAHRARSAHHAQTRRRRKIRIAAGAFTARKSSPWKRSSKKPRHYLDAAPRRARDAREAGERGRREPVPPAAPLQGSLRRLAARLPGCAARRGGEVLAEERQPRDRRGVRSRLRLGVALLREAAPRHDGARLPRERQGPAHRVLLVRLAARHRADRGDEQGTVLGQARRRCRPPERPAGRGVQRRPSWSKASSAS